VTDQILATLDSFRNGATRSPADRHCGHRCRGRLRGACSSLLLPNGRRRAVGRPPYPGVLRQFRQASPHTRHHGCLLIGSITTAIAADVFVRPRALTDPKSSGRLRPNDRTMIAD
jgi:hypothetical protein